MAWSSKAGTLVQMGRYEEGIMYFDKAIEAEPDFAPPWVGKGATLYLLKRYKESKECLKKAEELGLPEAREMLEHLEREGH